MPLLLLLLLLLWSPPQDGIRLIDKRWYRVGYSELYQGPVWCEYKVFCIQGGHSRRGLDFYPEPGVRTADHRDFADNVWDKGHLAPAADFACDSLALRATFSYVNAALQHQRLNRGPWRELESWERQLAATADVRVYIRVLYSDSTLPTGARLPSIFEKSLYWGDSTATYRFPNAVPSSASFRDYRID